MGDYTTFRGYPCCVCLAEWLPVYERELLRRHVIKFSIDIYQLRGNAGPSAGTHAKGGAADLYQRSRTALLVSRNMGAAGWERDADPHDGQPDFRPSHQHLVLKGCPHNSPARYQIPALEAGRNGLGANGRGGPDDGPRQGVQWPLRTWREGIAWAKTQAAGQPVPTPPPAPTTTRLDIGMWNVASPKPGWFKTPWAARKDRIGQTLADMACSIIGTCETHYSYQTADILAKLGSHYAHVSSPIGNDLFFDQTKYDQTRPFKEYSLGAQNRYAGVLHLVREQTSQPLTAVHTHFPYGSNALRSVAARNLVKLLATVDGPIILTGDFNNQSFAAGTPHYYLRRAGYDFMRQQAQVVNGNKPEYPGKGQWLSDIATDRDRASGAKITSGELLLTSSTLSDHRPLKARVSIA